MGFGDRHCAVIGCPNNGKRLNKWASMNCELHNCSRESKECVCEPPLITDLTMQQRQRRRQPQSTLKVLERGVAVAVLVVVNVSLR